MSNLKKWPAPPRRTPKIPPPPRIPIELPKRQPANEPNEAGCYNDIIAAIQQEEHYLAENPQPRRPPRYGRAQRTLMTEEEKAEASARAMAWLAELRRSIEEVKAEQAARQRRTEKHLGS